MTVITSAPQSVAPLVKYDVSEAEIAAARARFAALTADTPKGYEEVRLAIAHVRDIRVAVEKRRVELKADALAYGRMVDSEAKRITASLLEIEEPLKAKKEAVDAEKERARQAVIETKRLEMEAQLRAEREAEEARIRAEREAEEARLKALREAEEARLAEERKRLDAERQQLAEERLKAEAAEAERRERERVAREAEEAKLRAEREALEAERRAVEAARQKAEREEFERQAKITAEREAAERAECDRIAKLEREREIAALLPDVEKLKAFAASIRALTPPKVKAKKVAALVANAGSSLVGIATTLEEQAGRL